MTEKKPDVVVVVLGAWISVAVLAIIPWIRDFRLNMVAVLSLIAALVWWIVLLWSMHHLAFQLVSFTRRPSQQAQNSDRPRIRPRIAILYTTCDDFNPAACQSCVNQNYPDFRVLVLDDSEKRPYQRIVRKFCKESHPVPCDRVIRKTRNGYKAGNLNYALKNHVTEDWVLLVDADQYLEPDFLSSLVQVMPATGSDIPFVQAANREWLSSKSSRFQRLMSLAIPFYYRLDLPARQRFGFVPLLGHGTMLSRSAWSSVGGFPEIVSEDLGFALRCAAEGKSGAYVSEPVAKEHYPFDFGGFVVRLRKYAAGTAELIRKERGFLTGEAHFAEKWDAVMQIAWYPLMPLIVLNGFLTAYVLHKLWREGVPYLSPVLPFLYVWMVFAIICLFVFVSQGPLRGLQFYFWSTAIHASVMPVAGVSFARHLLGGRAVFQVTPKNGERTPLAVPDMVMTVILGCLTLAAAVMWYSPFSPVLFGQGVAEVCYPLYGRLCSTSLSGRAGRGQSDGPPRRRAGRGGPPVPAGGGMFASLVARLMIYPPGILMLLGLYTVWQGIGLTLPVNI